MASRNPSRYGPSAGGVSACGPPKDLPSYSKRRRRSWYWPCTSPQIFRGASNSCQVTHQHMSCGLQKTQPSAQTRQRLQQGALIQEDCPHLERIVSKLVGFRIAQRSGHYPQKPNRCLKVSILLCFPAGARTEVQRLFTWFSGICTNFPGLPLQIQHV